MTLQERWSDLTHSTPVAWGAVRRKAPGSLTTNPEAAGSSPAGIAIFFNELAHRRLLVSEQFRPDFVHCRPHRPIHHLCVDVQRGVRTGVSHELGRHLAWDALDLRLR